MHTSRDQEARANRLDRPQDTHTCIYIPFQYSEKIGQSELFPPEE